MKTRSRWEFRDRVAQMVIALFDRWELSLDDRSALLDVSEGALSHFCEGDGADSSRDQFGRVGHLLAIHKSLRLPFPQTRDLGYRWMTTRNKAFDGHTPVEIVRTQGFRGC